MSIRHYIFHHREDLLDRVKPKDMSRFEAVDLNQVRIPDYLRFSGLSLHRNRLLYSEYLGILTIKPTTELVGLFPYSIPIKFSKDWADKTGSPHVFLPEIVFDDLDRQFDPDKIYSAELGNPECAWVWKIHESFLGLGGEISHRAPFKGCLVLSREKFREFQVWFEEAARFMLTRRILKVFELRSWKTGQYHWKGRTRERNWKRKWAGIKDDGEMANASMRHGTGAALERLFAYYFGQTVRDEDKIGLGDFLSED